MNNWTSPGGPLLLVAHPSPDRYGSDLQMVTTAMGAIAAGWRVCVVLPGSGPLVKMLQDCGTEVIISPFPVLRKALFSPLGMLRLALSVPVAIVRLTRRVRHVRADAVYVNTVTIPLWLAAARLARVPVVAHVHEAEEEQPKLVRWALAAPLLMANEIVVNSAAAQRALTTVVPRLARRMTIVHNGVPDTGANPAPPRPRAPSDPGHIVMVGRLSPRKGADVALEAVAILREQGRDVTLTICGTAFPGYEWYEAQLQDRCSRKDLAGRATLAGYVNPTWPVLESADVVIVPSRVEPFGNAAVEALLARRPVVASRVQGLQEVIDDDRTGILVAPGDSASLARGIAEVLDDPGLAAQLAASGREDALQRFSVTKYHDKIMAVLARLG